MIDQDDVNYSLRTVAIVGKFGDDNGITWKERHLLEINSEALINNYFYTFL